MLACRRHRALCREEGAVAASLEPGGNSGCPSLRVQGSEEDSGVSEFHSLTWSARWSSVGPVGLRCKWKGDTGVAGGGA